MILSTDTVALDKITTVGVPLSDTVAILVGLTCGVTSMTGRMVKFGGGALKWIGRSQMIGTVPGSVLKIHGRTKVASFTLAGMGVFTSILVPVSYTHLTLPTKRIV